LRKALVGALIAAAVMAGCGGDDEETTTAGGSQETTQTQPTETAAATPEGIPTYEEAAKIALDGRSTPCKNRYDRDIGSYPDGETYKRLFCSSVPQMDYVVGKEAVTENFDAARKQRSPIWGLEGEAYITGPPLDDDFAERIKDSCDCGEVVPGTLK
jgi:hypothetical protein